MRLSTLSRRETASLSSERAEARCEVSYDGLSSFASILASGLRGVVGDTIDATVMLLVLGDTSDTVVFAAIGDGVFSATDE
jgi:hypothetical protein